MSQILDIAARSRRREINSYLFAAFDGMVQNGPFRGMRLPTETAWLDGDISPKLLGVYEEELHDAIAHSCQHSYSDVINIGCGEGYYAIGFARLLPHANITACDTNVDAERICRDAALANSVAHRLQTIGSCDPEVLRQLLSSRSDCLIVSDCEGAEIEILRPDLVPDLRFADLIVECHDLVNPSITPLLTTMFERTHDIRLIHEHGRDPNRFPILRDLPSVDRFLAVCEFRPGQMHWLTCWARTRKMID